MIELLTTPFVQRALLAALLVGLAAPVVGTYLVQRRLSLLGDGIGHVALTGVATGWLVGAATGATDAGIYAVPGAVIAALIGALAIEWIRDRRQAGGDVALALLFYGGIASGVVIMTLAGGTSARLLGYLFGSLATVSTGDLVTIAVMAALILLVGLGLRSVLFSASHDEAFARASGLPVRWLNAALAALAALTVTVSMQVVGLLLVSALMIVPVATAQLLRFSFRNTMAVAMAVGAVVCVAGLGVTLFYRLPPGATIVCIAVALYAAIAVLSPLWRRKQHPRDPHPDVPDDVVIPGKDKDASCDQAALSDR